ncbi:M48 family metalloprotease [Streptomyces sp. NPDC090445]|uniref:M48 family metalloprotease n=1 Tax=Streptomyces sp. NPDC090445 TaxID=3365963 RepID=UPI0037F94511
MNRRTNLLVGLLDGSVNGLTFGRAGKRYVMLSRGLITLHRTDPEALRAIVLHELAHLRNRDVDIAYLDRSTCTSEKAAGPADGSKTASG